MKKLAIDPGHFGGMLSVLEDRHFVFGGGKPIKEGDLNLKVAKLLKKELDPKKFDVLIVRESFENFKDALLWNKKDFENFKNKNWEERTTKIKSFKPDLTLAVHFNANCYSSKPKETQHDGVMTFIYSDKDKVLVKNAEIIAAELSKAFGLPFCEANWFEEEVSKNWSDIGKGVNIRDLYILRNIDTPVVLTEGPFMNNKNNYLKLIKDDKLLKTYAQALAKAVREVLK